MCFDYYFIVFYIYKEELIRTTVISQHRSPEGTGWGEGRLEKTLLILRNNSLYMVDHGRT
jgi:hypothetical protein